MRKHRTPSKIKEWPEGFQECSKCNILKPFCDFIQRKDYINGVTASCKLCDKHLHTASWKRHKSKLTTEERMLNNAKHRASKRGLEFSIELSDITIPEQCPIFRMPFVGQYRASLDRINSTEGYVKGNIQVISHRANMIKNCATLDELEAIVSHWQRYIREN